MFTGITEHVGKIESLEHGKDGGRLRVSFRNDSTNLISEADSASACEAEIARGTKSGDSIAVNGCCLTVVSMGPGWWAADAVPETLGRTTLGQLRPGDPVNRATDAHCSIFRSRRGACALVFFQRWARKRSFLYSCSCSCSCS